MHRVWIIVVLINGLIVCCQAVREFHCQYTSDGIFENKVEQSLSSLKDFQLIYFDDCEDALNKGNTIDGVYRIKPATSARPFSVWCDMNAEDGGWIVIQTRFDGLVDFERTWKEYRNGFGNVNSEHWLGNNFIHQITQTNELKIDMTGFMTDEYATVKYSPFRIGSEDEKYKLFIGAPSYGGGEVIPERMTIHNGSIFSAKDSETGGCANVCRGAWWYLACYHSNLNGVWMSDGQSAATQGPQTDDNVIGIVWTDLFGKQFYSLKSVEMKVRKIK
ncbi:ryncolin-1-like [Bradysia coprophila]|uniref:ryncolin-1-like n=1 Tax=Bradysia coprophila TaxID=38358 RepID=UPI00187D9288|nr:ryncolin-1-like [Bradysia coprophila]